MSDVQTVWDSHNGAILVIDTQGKECVKAELPQAVTVFLLPPSDIEMERRLRDRGTDTEAIIQARLHRATTEIKDAYTYDEVIVNYDINDTVKAIRKLILG